METHFLASCENTVSDLLIAQLCAEKHKRNYDISFKEREFRASRHHKQEGADTNKTALHILGSYQISIEMLFHKSTPAAGCSTVYTIKQKPVTIRALLILTRVSVSAPGGEGMCDFET